MPCITLQCGLHSVLATYISISVTLPSPSNTTSLQVSQVSGEPDYAMWHTLEPELQCNPPFSCELENQIMQCGAHRVFESAPDMFAIHPGTMQCGV